MTRPNILVETLKASADFQRLSRQGKRWSGPTFILQAARKEDELALRFGLTASRKVGNAVIRNRAKRRLREVVRLFCKTHMIAGWDIVLIAKTAATDAPFERVQAEFEKGLRALGVVQ